MTSGEREKRVRNYFAKPPKQPVKDYVKANLATYKAPREVVFLTELPRNATGKVLKRELTTS